MLKSCLKVISSSIACNNALLIQPRGLWPCGLINRLIQPTRYGFQQGILEAGYDPVRIDHIEHINRIDDEIIAQINASRFVVADFTGHRGGVYFEAGYALGLGLPVFWSRREIIGRVTF